MPARRTITKSHYETLAALRHTLSKFLLFSQEEARTAGLTPQQHQALLAIKGYPDRDYVSVGELAAQLHLRHHSAVGLIDRLVQRQLVRRTTSTSDKRRVEVTLTARGEALINRLSAAHWKELQQLGPEIFRALDTIMNRKPVEPDSAK